MKYYEKTKNKNKLHISTLVNKHEINPPPQLAAAIATNKVATPAQGHISLIQPAHPVPVLI